MQNRWKTIAWVIGPLAAVAVVAFFIFRPSVDLFPTPPNASGTAASTATAFPTPEWQPIDVTSLAVREVPFEQGATVYDFVLAGGRLIATGSQDDDPAAWYSDDAGETWSRAEVQTLETPRAGSVIEMESVAAYGATLAAMGQWHQRNEGTPLTLSIWISHDAGTHWSEAPRDGVPREVIGLAAGRFGFMTQRGPSRILVSTDALTWNELEHDASLGRSNFGSVVANGDMLIATGNGPQDGTPEAFTDPYIWTYTDAAGWATVSKGELGPALMGRAVADSGGFYVNGVVLQDPTPEHFQLSRAALWESSDGSTWRQRILNSTLGSNPTQLAHGGLGTLVMGDDQADDLKLFAWFIRNDQPVDEPAQEYRIDTRPFAVIGLQDRFVAFAECAAPRPSGLECQPTMLIFEASAVPYTPASSSPSN